MQLSRIPKYIQVLGIRYYRHHRPSETQILVILSFVVGISTGLGAVLFIRLIEFAKEFFFGYSLSYLNQFIISWKFWVPIIPLAGGLIVGPIVYKFAREARGHGVPEVMEAVALRGGYYPAPGGHCQIRGLGHLYRIGRFGRTGGTDCPDRIGHRFDYRANIQHVRAAGQNPGGMRRGGRYFGGL